MRGRWRLPMLLMLAWAVALAWAWWLRRDAPPARPLPPPPGGQAGAAPPAPPEPPPRTTAATVLVFKTTYPDCGPNETQVHVQPAGPELAGLDRAALAARHPGWQVRAFSPAQVELSRTVPGRCPEAPEGFTITLRDGVVVVLRGRGLGGPLHRRTGILADRLTPAERQMLERGLVVGDQEELRHVLESLEETSDPGGA